MHSYRVGQRVLIHTIDGDFPGTVHKVHDEDGRLPVYLVETDRLAGFGIPKLVAAASSLRSLDYADSALVVTA